jgi:hypothetical protein
VCVPPLGPHGYSSKLPVRVFECDCFKKIGFHLYPPCIQLVLPSSHLFHHHRDWKKENDTFLLACDRITKIAVLFVFGKNPFTQQLTNDIIFTFFFPRSIAILKRDDI